MISRPRQRTLHEPCNGRQGRQAPTSGRQVSEGVAGAVPSGCIVRCWQYPHACLPFWALSAVVHRQDGCHEMTRLSAYLTAPPQGRKGIPLEYGCWWWPPSPRQLQGCLGMSWCVAAPPCGWTHRCILPRQQLTCTLWLTCAADPIAQLAAQLDMPQPAAKRSKLDTYEAPPGFRNALGLPQQPDLFRNEEPGEPVLSGAATNLPGHCSLSWCTSQAGLESCSQQCSPARGLYRGSCLSACAAPCGMCPRRADHSVQTMRRRLLHLE